MENKTRDELARAKALADIAVKAARCWNNWGPYAASAYATKRGVPPELMTLARVLAAAERMEKAWL